MVVVLTWLGLLAAGIYGTSQMRVEADVNNFISEGSYLRSWIDTSDESFTQTGAEVGLYWVNDAAVRRCYYLCFRLIGFGLLPPLLHIRHAQFVSMSLHGYVRCTPRLLQYRT